MRSDTNREDISSKEYWTGKEEIVFKHHESWKQTMDLNPTPGLSSG